MRAALLMLLLMLGGVLQLEAREAKANEEIEFLLNHVATSDVRFIRNGTAYDAKQAADHLRSKLGAAGERVKSAEDFINGVATKSYFSGNPYLVKLQDGKTTPAATWLLQALMKHRLIASEQKPR
jgi:hypothetical protein